MNAPIILFVYNRPKHTLHTIEALKKSDGAKESCLIIYADGAKNGRDPKVEEVRDIAHKTEGFASVEIVEREKNIGLAQNIIEGVTDVIGKYGKAIVLEDDLEVSEGFLKYMNAALEYYKDKGVFSVAGYSPNIDIPQDYKHSTYAINRNCSWGWGTWKKKWDKVDWDVKDFDTFISSREKRKEFDKSGSDLSAMLLRQRIGEIHSWSIRFCYAGYKSGEPTIYPVDSLVGNIGTDGSGTNMRRTEKYETKVTDKIDSDRFVERIEIDSRIEKSFRRKYGCSIYRRIINHLKILKYKMSMK